MNLETPGSGPVAIEGIDAALAADTDAAARPLGLSPSFLAYVVGPIALALLLLMRRYGLVARVPIWAYIAAIVGAQVTGRLVDVWREAPPGSLRLHLRVAVHVAAVTSVLYLCGWGPALGMAFAFSALADLQQSGAAAWRAALGWSLAGCAAGQLLVLEGWAPSFLSNSQAQTIGFLGAFVFGIAIRMAGAIGEYKEQVERELADQTLQAARARDNAQRSEAHYRAVVENAAEGILTCGVDGRIGSFNTAAEAMFGWTAREIIGQSASLLVPATLHEHLEAFLLAETATGDPAVNRHDVEVAGVRRDGTQFPMMISTSAIAVDGAPVTVSAIIRDLSDQKRFEAQLAHQGLHDALTGLPNRMMLTDRMEHALARVRRRDGMFCVLFVDLDRFKAVNDTLGHTVGDELLIQAAARIQATVREVDTVARLGGDEFVVLCEDLDNVHQATLIAERIIAAVGAPFYFGDDATHVSASIGIALCVDACETPDAILANADIAMYRAKNNGRSCYELFDAAMQQWVTTQAELEAALRQAVPRNELRLFFQPIVSAESGVVRGFEALVRWERPGVGLMMPADFIPIAEDTRLILEIGAWVVEEACHRAAEWARRWPDRRLGVAVNLSSRQLQSGDVVDVVRRALAKSGLDPSMLTLELTETMLIDDAVSVEMLLHDLKHLGVNIALDDFGTGYSSLTYLRSFPIDIVKIDQSFIRAIGTEREDTAIVAAVIALAKNLDVTVVAEGVENHEQLAVLLHLQCPYLQGYLFARPRPVDELAELVEAPTLGIATATGTKP